MNECDVDKQYKQMIREMQVEKAECGQVQRRVPATIDK
jgi:hypothetical protein